VEFVGIRSEGDSEVGSEGGEGDRVGEVDHCYQPSTEQRAKRGVSCEDVDKMQRQRYAQVTELRRDDGREEYVKHGWGLTIFALGLNLDQYLLLSHDLDNLPNVRSGFTKD
jgi:hypothetical protein